MTGSLADSNNFRRGKIVVLLAVLAVATGLYSVHLGMDQNADLKTYHLYIPFAALDNRYLYDIAPTAHQTYYNPVLDFPFFIMVEFFNDWPRSIAFVQGAIHGTNLLCVALISWHLLGGIKGISQAQRMILTGIALLIGATGGGSMPLIGTTTGDLQAAVPTLAALLFAIRAIDRAQTEPTRALRGITISGTLAGIAVGAKLTMGTFGIAIAASLLVLPRDLLVRSFLRFAAAGVGGFLIGGGLHLFRMWRLFGNPFFPMFNNVFRSPYWEATAFRDRRFLPKTWIDWVVYPFEWARDTGHGIVSELAFRDIRIALAFALGGIAALTWLISRLTGSSRRTHVFPGIRALTIFVLIGYLSWLALFSIYRYLMPLELLSGLLIVLGLGAIARRDAWPVLCFAVAALCMVTTIPLEWGHADFSDRYIKVNAPAIAPDTLVVLVEGSPVAHIIPFVDPKVRWVNVMDWFLHPEQHNLLRRRARDLIQQHSGPLLMLQGGATTAEIDQVLSSVSLAREPGKCASISSNLEEKEYALCPIMPR
jgi:hypothetical protein